MKGKKNAYLNRAILMIATPGYVAVLVLLLCLDFFEIASYQREKRQAEEEFFSGSMNKIENDMENIKNILNSIYSNDKNYDTLSGNLSNVLQYSNAYDLANTLNIQQILNGELAGYYIYYGSEMVLYNADKKAIPMEDQINLRDLLKGIQSTGKWIYIETYTGHQYMTTAFVKGNVMIAGVYSLWENMDILNSQNNGEGLFSFSGENNGEEISPTINKWALTDMVKEYNEQFRVVRRGTQLYGKQLAKSNGWGCLIIPLSIWSYFGIPQMILLTLTASSMVVMVLLYKNMYKEIVNPLHQITEAMKSIKKNQMETVPEFSMKYQEIRELNETLTSMVTEIKRQKLKSYDEMLARQEAQLQFYQLQLKPHFYLNCLKTLNVMAIDNGNEDMQALILSISKHLRYLLQTDKRKVLLREEKDYVSNYIYLQNCLIGRSITCEFFIEDDTMEIEVPTLCIQSFVENSVKYAKLGKGIKKLEIIVNVNLLQTEKEQFLNIVVNDNGQGYPYETLRQINGEPEERSKNVGINNLKKRCIFLYGQAVHYSFYNLDGAVSELFLPIKNEGDKDECIISG